MRITFNLQAHTGRGSLFSYATEAARLADSMDSLAGRMLTYGFDAAYPIVVRPNGAHLTLAPIVDAILGGLRSRVSTNEKTGAETIKRVLNGTAFSDVERKLMALDLNTPCDYEVVEGRRRIIAALIAYACGRDDILDSIRTIDYTGKDADADAFRYNEAQASARKVDPSGKVDAGLMVMERMPSITETELGRVLGLKRGDAQLAHRGATAFRRYSLEWQHFTVGANVRVPSKELLGSTDKPAPGTLLACADRSAALEWVGKFLREEPLREKLVGSDILAKVLASVPEDKMVDPRKLAVAMQTRATFDAYIASL